MNKQEALKRIEAQKETLIRLTGWAVYVYIEELIKSIDEPEKVKVPQFVADWYEENKDDFEFNIWDWMKYNLEPKKRENIIFSQWLGKTVNNPVETLIKMKLYGYEVEEEKRYRVSMPKARNHKNHAQILCEKDGKIFWCGEWYPFRTKFTRKQLEEAGFSEVFNSPLFEVEEVEE